MSVTLLHRENYSFDPPELLNRENGEIDSTSSTQSPPVITSRHKNVDDSKNLVTMAIIDSEGLIGRAFLMDKQEDEQKFRAKLVETINAHDKKVHNNPEFLRFKCFIINDQYEEILAYNDIVHHLYLDQESDNLWKFKDITAHEGSLCQTDKTTRVHVIT